MKILHVVAGDMGGGANRGAANLNDLMVQQGLTSDILNLRNLKSYSSRGLALAQRRLNHHLCKIISPKEFFNLFLPLPSPDLAIDDADIINLHWSAGHIAPSFFSRHADKLVVTLRDEWMFTGGCHTSLGCHGFQEGCPSCPIVIPSARALVERSARLKHDAFRKLRAPIISIGENLAKRARGSSVMAGKEIVVIPNYIPALLPDPHHDESHRFDYFLFVATNLDVFHKGADLLEEVGAPVYMVGSPGSLSPSRFGPQVRFLGPVLDRKRLANLIAGARALLVPSRAEAFGKVVLEAFSVGTPVIAHAIDELALLVEPGRNGFLVNESVPSAFSTAVKQLEQFSDDRYLKMRQGARARYDELMKPEAIVQRHLEVYQRVG